MEAMQVLERLRQLWRAQTGPSARRAGAALIGAVAVGAAVIARFGTTEARLVALALLLSAPLPLVWRWRVERRRQRDARALIGVTLLRADPALGERTLRALDLGERTVARPETGSPALARLHLQRLLARAPLDAIADRAGKNAWRWSLAAVLLACGAFVAVVTDPFAIVEGADVLVAREGVAPLTLPWVEELEISAEPPSYLGEPRRSLEPYFPTALPRGSAVTVRLLPRRAGRALVLTDGREEVPFHEDGAGAFIARWTIENDVQLGVAARFGEVRIDEPERLQLDVIPDLAPFVRLEGAPKTIRLLDHDRIPIHYEASDDHGLREVVLVLRAGEREERRVLSQPQGSTRSDRGGMVLQASDRFLERTHLPIEITVQARDGDPVSGPKWGRSDPIVVIPPDIGEREALRYLALLEARDALTDLLAARLPPPADRAEHQALERRIQASATAELARVLDGRFGGLTVPGRVRALVRGQLQRVQAALQKELGAPSAASHDALVERTETLLLAADAAVDALGDIDTRRSARKMADVAQDAADAIAESREAGERDRSERRMKADLEVLDAGGKQLLRLGAGGPGSLGLDLGEIVANGLRRIDRAWSAGDRYHARLAAEDLAARLRVPDPSFAGGGGGQGDGHGHGQGQGGVEAGGEPQPGQGQASEAAQQAHEIMQELEELRLEHAAEMGMVERALEQAKSNDDKQQMQGQLDELAKEVREAVAGLPRSASQSESARSAAAVARAQAEAMAGALERGELGEAVQHGKDAVDAAKDAEQRAQEAPAGHPEQQVGEQAKGAREKLERAITQAERAGAELGKGASERARGELERAAKRERELAERARQIEQKADQGEAPLPEELAQRLREAARAMDRAGEELGKGQGPRGLSLQRDAQRLLEMAQPESEPEEAREGEEEGDGKDFARKADVPGEHRDARAEEFRKRVVEGLKRNAPPHLEDALKRYAEGLLR